MKKRVWITRERMNQGAYYRVWLIEPEWDERDDRWSAEGRTMNSIPICAAAALIFLGLGILRPGECIEVKTSPSQLWVTP